MPITPNKPPTGLSRLLESQRFSQADRNRDGHLSRPEFRAHGAQIRDDLQLVCMALEDSFTQADANGDGRLSQAESVEAGAFGQVKAWLQAIYRYTTPMDYMSFFMFGPTPKAGPCPCDAPAPKR